MKIRLLKIFAAVAVLLSFGSCSLLKVSVDTGNPPLPASEANTRMMTRGFYYDLADEIARTADSVAAASSEIPVRIRAIRWKMQATRAAVTAVMQSNPDVALIDTWLLCVRMDSAFRRLPDSLLFAGQTPLVRKVVARLDKKAEHLAYDPACAGEVRVDAGVRGELYAGESRHGVAVHSGQYDPALDRISPVERRGNAV